MAAGHSIGDCGMRSQALNAALANGSTPSTLVVGRSDRVYNRTLMDLMATRATNVTEWDTSHSPVLSRPELVVELLRGLDPEDSVPLA